jgi:hypothetical protein
MQAVMMSREVEAARDEERQVVHRKLCTVAERRQQLDAEEAELLVLAEEIQIWRAFGCGSFLEYLERYCRHTPRAAKERVRLAERLQQLPLVAEAFRTHAISYSTARELARVASAETEQEWLEAASTLRPPAVEQLVAEHEYGDRPSDPPRLDGEVTLVLTVKRSTAALFRQTTSALTDERGEPGGERISDDDALVTLCRRAFAAAEPAVTPPAHQLTISTCRACRQVTAEAGGLAVPVGAAMLDRARCDADDLGDVEADTRVRVTSTVSKRLRRQIFARDQHRCQVPGCRATRNLDLHHIEFQQHGGRHLASNVLLLCSGHHQQLHEGALSIRGKAPDKLVIEWRAEAAVHVDPVGLDDSPEQPRSSPSLPGPARHWNAEPVGDAR